ncbi:MAG: hypothetical protein LJE60_14715 [Thiocapsa sp.]|jgi:hypothetical protein|nr:hypothetical protein [Thiocapsa sp.]MCG6898341.1 hypothetical protein [Thiocapsa sp.]
MLIQAVARNEADQGGCGLAIIGEESLGVPSLCCQVNTGDRRVLIDPGGLSVRRDPKAGSQPRRSVSLF